MRRYSTSYWRRPGNNSPLQSTRNELMDKTGYQRLIWQPLLKGSFLERLQVFAGDADVHSFVLAKQSPADHCNVPASDAPVCPGRRHTRYGKQHPQVPAARENSQSFCGHCRRPSNTASNSSGSCLTLYGTMYGVPDTTNSRVPARRPGRPIRGCVPRISMASEIRAATSVAFPSESFPLYCLIAIR